ncbi:MAG: 16S rRNA (cytosine(967)-C(5))-methyltransferase RsmB [Thermicanus sp.]|nr:16S rRNA (cytosine(967)-C(5))-methyltransferase RsmB [Thermicanus sp.]
MLTEMKKEARETALDILLRIEEEGAYSNLLMRTALDRSGMQDADKRLATELVYGVLTHRLRLDYAIRPYLSRPLEKLEPWVRLLLRLSFYQLLYLDKIPPYAIVNEAVKLAKRRGHEGIARLINGVLRSYLREPTKGEIPPDLPPARRLSLLYSHPEWMVKRWLKQYGEEKTEAMLSANNAPSPLTLRINPLRTTREELLSFFKEEGMVAMPSLLSPQGIRVTGGGNPASMPEYRLGLYSIQDESSMLVATLLKPEAGQRVLDACAAPGGKTSHIAELMKDEGEILANDIHPHKGSLIEEQRKRLGFTSIQVMTGDALTLSERVKGPFDRILIDAPCSGLGVIRRKPEIKWRKEEGELSHLPELQYALLERLSPLLGEKGLLIYSTCTVNQEENEEVIDRFLSSHPEFQPDESLVNDLPSPLLEEAIIRPGMLLILPGDFGTDGFFIARLKHG